MLFHPKLVAPKRLIAKFSVGTSRQLLRHQGTCHSSFNGIQAGSECDEAQDHINYCQVITTIVQRHGTAFSMV
jgi:hypothetical protein